MTPKLKTPNEDGKQRMKIVRNGRPKKASNQLENVWQLMVDCGQTKWGQQQKISKPICILVLYSYIYKHIYIA